MAQTVKTASKKVPGTSKTGIKYEDKSAGQPALVPIFQALKNLLLPYEKGALKLRGGEGGQVMLVSEKEMEKGAGKKNETWFAAALIQKGYVGFYFMPVKTEQEKKAMFKPELLKCLKGKTCFHIKENDPLVFKQINESLRMGYQKFVERGYV